jgi:hypothetical protein
MEHARAGAHDQQEEQGYPRAHAAGERIEETGFGSGANDGEHEAEEEELGSLAAKIGGYELEGDDDAGM